MSFIRKIKKNGKIYLAEVEGKRVNGKVVQKHIRYIGKEVNGETVISLSSKDIQVDSVKVYGPLLAFHTLARKIGLTEILGEYSNEILSMVYAHCTNYKSLRNMPRWYKQTDLNLILDLEGLTESRLVSAMDSLNDDQIVAYQKDIFINVRNLYQIDSKGLVYDLTNTYFHGKQCPMGKIGRSKDGQRKNDLIQIALATTQKEGIPAFHKTFDGNTHDSRTLADISDNFSQYGFRSGLLIYDRGITSEKNLSLIKKLGWHTLCGLTMREKEKSIVRKLLKSGSMNHISNMIQIGDSTFYVKGMSHSFGSVRGKIAICYNESKKLVLTQSRRLLILEAQELRRKNKDIDEALEKYLTPTGRIRTEILEREEELDGYSCLFCTKNIPHKEMVKLYFDKDVVEKAFKTMKGVSNIRPIRFWLKKQVKAHVFICYLSYLLLSVLKLDLKSKGLNKSTEQVIEELETMYNVYFSDKRNKIQFIKTVVLKKEQEKIIRSIDPKLLKKHIIK